ncbi:endonuclease/Exonuclease/phosphatase [Cercophora newfieldiana]|uniref:Endonuclease/Exonuclease/phosphatase n=1 Tax=Cercophora newfieldiana TaxID=92897 RepID=A0AA39YBG9_9PEZI|nr:endonuclease/Exonuclease/phosphatase [Cercophora newfieldiana]
MKPLSRLFLFLLLPLASPALTSSLPLRLVSFNIRYAATTLLASELPWSSPTCSTAPLTCRRPHVTSHLLNITTTTTSAPTLLSLQEVLASQLTDLTAALGPTWSSLGTGRDDGFTHGEYVPILYDTSRLRCLSSTTKWLSPAPDIPSLGWGAATKRIVTLGVFETRSFLPGFGKRFLVANTHPDHKSGEARTEGLKVAIAQVQETLRRLGPMGVVLAGDFNSVRGAEAHKALSEGGYLEELFDVASAEGKVRGTNRATATGWVAGGKTSWIDFLWVGPKGEGKWTVQGYEILDNVEKGVYFSDHRAVVGDVTLV